MAYKWLYQGQIDELLDVRNHDDFFTNMLAVKSLDYNECDESLLDQVISNVDQIFDEDQEFVLPTNRIRNAWESGESVESIAKDS